MNEEAGEHPPVASNHVANHENRSAGTSNSQNVRQSDFYLLFPHVILIFHFQK